MSYRRLFNPVHNQRRRCDGIDWPLGIEECDRVLDVNCGHGPLFEAFNATNRIVGVDRNLSDYSSSNVAFHLANGVELPFADGGFDGAVPIV